MKREHNAHKELRAEELRYEPLRIQVFLYKNRQAQREGHGSGGVPQKFNHQGTGVALVE